MPVKNNVVMLSPGRPSARMLRDLIVVCLQETFPSPKYKVVTEHQFSPERRFRFDVAVVGRRCKVAIEFQGGTWRKGGGAHRGVGFERDCEKVLVAGTYGWLVIPLTYDQLRSNFDDVLAKLVQTIRTVGDLKPS